MASRKNQDEDKQDQVADTPDEAASSQVKGSPDRAKDAESSVEAPGDENPDTATEDAPEPAQDNSGPDDSEPQDTADTEPEGRRSLRQRAQAAESQVESLTAEVEALRAQVTAARKGQVATVAQTKTGPFSPALAAGDDLFAVGGHDVDAFLDPETGNVDPEAVLQAVVALLEQRPGLKKTGSTRPDPALHSSQRPGLPSEPNRGAAWVQALRNK